MKSLLKRFPLYIAVWAMGIFRGKRKKGLRLSIYRKPLTYASKNEKPMTIALHAFSSPSYFPDRKKVAGYHIRPGTLKVSIMCFSPRQRMWTILRDITASLCQQYHHLLVQILNENSIGNDNSKEVNDSYKDIAVHIYMKVW